MATFEDNLAKSEAVGADKKQLLQRLQETRSCLTDEYKKSFGKGKFDFANKRLISDSGTWCLQWQTRQKPNEPQSYENQQTNCGTVILKNL